MTLLAGFSLLALGAPLRGLLGMVVVEGLKPTRVGVPVGLLVAAMLVRVMATLLFVFVDGGSP